jgi:hypothetical protein
MIPPFDARGLLPHDCQTTLDELELSFLVTGKGVDSSSWDAPWRHQLVQNLRAVARTFWQAGGVREIWIDGSFVEARDQPGDIDCLFFLDDLRDWATGAFQARLNAVEGEDLWNWSDARRRLYPGAKIPKPPFWGKYRIEMFPEFGRFCGITGPAGQLLTFSQAFRQQRGTFERKGILSLVR